MFSLIVTILGGAETQRTIYPLRSEGEQRVREAIGRKAASLTREHLYRMANERHRANVAHNFYGDAADAVTFDDNAEAAVVVRIAKTGIAQRYYGGRIEAVNYRHLWIPIAPESEGKTAGEFDDLIPIVNPLTNRGVAVPKDNREHPLFALVPEVTQEADPSVLPTEEEYTAAAESAIAALLDFSREMAAAGGATEGAAP